MEKIKIYATGNERISGDYNVSFYIVSKNDSFFDWLGKLIEEVLGIENGVMQTKYWHKTKYDENGIEIGEEIIEKDINKIIDYHEKYVNNAKEEKGDKLDIFYGDRRVFLTFRKSRETRQKFAKFLIKHTEWINEEEAKAFREANLNNGSRELIA